MLLARRTLKQNPQFALQNPVRKLLDPGDIADQHAHPAAEPVDERADAEDDDRGADVMRTGPLADRRRVALATGPQGLQVPTTIAPAIEQASPDLRYRLEAAPACLHRRTDVI